MGHTNTQMLFTVYSRFVPNLTRQDGLAIAGLLSSKQAAPPSSPLTSEQIDAMNPKALRALLKQNLQAKTPTTSATH